MRNLKKGNWNCEISHNGELFVAVCKNNKIKKVFTIGCKKNHLLKQAIESISKQIDTMVKNEVTLPEGEY
jgi:hypothetical protein